MGPGTPGPPAAPGPAGRLASWLERRCTRLIVGWLALLAVAGSAYAAHVGSTLQYSEEQQYLTLADNLSNHGMFSLDGRGPTAYRPPMWPMLLAVLRFVGAGVVELRIANILLFTLAVWLVYRIATVAGGPLAGLLAALVLGAYPLLVYTATTLYPQTLALLLLATALWLLTRRELLTWRTMLAVGVVLGLLVLTVSTFVYVLPFLALVRPDGWRRYASRTAVVVLGLALIVGPWTVRNYEDIHHVFFAASNSGFNLILGNSEHVGADTGVDADISKYTAPAGAIGDEVVRDNYYRDHAVTWITSHPATAGWLYVRKLANFFNSANRLSTTGKTSLAQGALLTSYYVAVLLLLAWRWVRRRVVPFTRFEYLVLGLYVLGALLSAVFFTRARFRGPFDLLLILAVSRLAVVKRAPSMGKATGGPAV